MDKRNRNIIALGLLTIVSTIVFFWGLYFLLGNTVFTGGTDIYIALEDGGGLKRGDRVHLQGVEVGSVQSVRLTPQNLVVAQLRVRPEITLPADTRASVTGDVFGAHAVQLVPGTSLVRVEEGDTLSGVRSEALTELASGLGAQARSLLSTADSVLASADSLLSPATVRDVQATTAVLPATARELRAAFTELRLAAASLHRTSVSFESANTGERVAGTAEEMQRSAQALTAAANSMERSLDSFASVMAKIEGGQGTLGRLVNDTSLYYQFHQTVRELGALASDIRERPQRYINVRIF